MIERKHRRSMLGVTVALALVGSLAVGVVAGAGASSQAARSHAHAGPALTKLGFHDDMRKLWEDHVTWTRLLIVSFAADLPDLGPTTDRLLQNQADIGDAIRPFYGDTAGDRLTELLTEHITTAADVLAAARSGDGDAFDEASAAWYRNARQIARFLHEANPDNWPLRPMRRMMREHLDLTLAEASHRLAGDYAKDVAAYEAVHLEILHMADMLSRGIIRQFPEMFD